MAWSKEQKHNAQIIIQVGRQLGASDRDIQIALMTAITESNLVNVNYGDRDSLGVFQQRAAWGSRDQRMNVAESAKMFFTGGHAGQRGLFDITNRNQMSMGAAAQAVQVSAYPDRYAQQTQAAANLLGLGGGSILGIELGGGQAPTEGQQFQHQKKQAQQAFDPTFATDNGQGDPNYLKPAVEQTSSGTAGVGAYAAPMSVEDLPDPNSDLAFTLPQKQDGSLDLSALGGGGGAEGWRRQVRKIAKRYLGTPYVWGGTSPSGFDCSGFVQYVYKQMGVDLPRVSYQQATSGKRIGLDALRAGDLVAWDNSSRNNGADHIAIYLGNGMIIEAPRPGASVQLSHLYDQDIAWGVRMHA